MKGYIYDQLQSFKNLKEQYETIKALHLKDQLKDTTRTHKFQIEHDNFIFDYTRQNFTMDTLPLFKQLADEAGLFNKINEMFDGKHINVSEGRAVLHMALRAQKGDKFAVDGKDVLEDIHKTLANVKIFTEDVRNGKFKGATGKKLTDFVVIGIGGSYLSIEFVSEALKFNEKCYKQAQGYTIKYLPNVDPLDFFRVTDNLNPETTLFIINSKTFTTAETILNAETCRDWIVKKFAIIAGSISKQDIVSKHFCAVTSNVKLATEFGLNPANLYDFGVWVGGRYSVWSPIGILPLSLYFGFENMKEFLDGGRDIDTHFKTEKDITKNIPIMMGMIEFYNTSIQDMRSKAILPYAQALQKFVPHIQQLTMESNGKNVNLEGNPLPGITCPAIFGEPGTNGQHSFYQLIHQGMVIPCEFIGYIHSLREADIKSSAFLKNHDEFMANFFAQPDALALGSIDKSDYKKFYGNRPSCCILFDDLNPYSLGQLLAIYEHRVAVEGFLYHLNSFDQMGVELGKVLAKGVREVFKNPEANLKMQVESSSILIKKYMDKRKKLE